MSKCKVCNSELGEIPMCFGSGSPASLMVPPEEYDKRVLENDDQCIVDGEHYFIRGHIEIPVSGTEEVFIWSVWVSLSEQSFEHMSEKNGTQRVGKIAILILVGCVRRCRVIQKLYI